MTEVERRASQGKYRVVGEDRYSYEDFFVGEYGSKEEAFNAANKGRTRAMKDATNSSIADAYYVFDDKGRALGRGYDFERISKAIEFAMQAHSGETRKGTTIPYIVHPLDVLSILMKNGADEDLAVAGVLHDVLEDTSFKLEDIKKEFGDAVARLVDGASEPAELTKGVSNEEKKKTWKRRKSEKIEKMKTASRELKLLVCADKLANVRDVLVEFHMKGDAMWSKFNASKEEQAWYYNSMINALGYGETSNITDREAYKELSYVVSLMFGKE